MVMMFRILLVLIAFIAVPAGAEINPSIVTRNGMVNVQGEPLENLRIETMDVDVDIVAGIAKTRIELVFFNAGTRSVEGEFHLRMPMGSIVTGFALDVDGQLLDGVLIVKERAEKAYTDRVREDIDPGIAEVVDTNIYKTRIFPIPGEGRRTIALEFVAPIGEDWYELPLETLSEIEDVKFTIRADQQALATIPNGVWDGSVNEQGARVLRAKNVRFDGVLRVPSHAGGLTLSTHKTHQTFISFPISPEEMAKLTPKKPKPINTVRIYWDHSLSRGANGNAHFSERRLVREYLTQLNPKTVEFIAGTDRVNHTEIFKRSKDGGRGWNALDTQINALDYDGASDLAILLGAGRGKADICLVFSDGHATLGGGKMPMPQCSLYTVSADENANQGFLKWLAQEGGGQFVGPQHSHAEGQEILSTPARARLVGGNIDDLRQIQMGGRSILIAPYDQNSPKIVRAKFVTANGKTIRLKRKTRKASDIRTHDGPATLWAVRKADELRAGGDVLYEALIAHSQQYTIVGPETSLLVLEGYEDYVDEGIAPPENFPAEELKLYHTRLAQNQAEQAEERAEWLDEVVDIWEQQKKWWATDFSVTKLEKMREPSTPVSQSITQNEPPPPAAPQLMREQASSSNSVGDSYGGGGGEYLDDGMTDEVIVTGARRNTIDIAIREWSPDRPYLEVLSQLSGDEFETAYRNHRETYGDLPAFYLEVADLLHRKGQTNLAAQRVLGALDLPSSNTQTMTVVANRLLIYGRYERAVEIYRRAVLVSVDRPQPYYDLALALIAHADHTADQNIANKYRMEALKQLDFVVRNPWDRDYEGMEIVALMDANAVIVQLPVGALEDVPLDARLIANLETDIRVVIDWNADEVDIDLWVKEPELEGKREQVMYSHALSSSGGQISNDMTDGYGPEQYVLRRSKLGLYTVQADYFDNDTYNPNGAIAIRARLYQNFGRANQTMSTTIVEFDDEDQDEYILGEITVGD